MATPSSLISQIHSFFLNSSHYNKWKVLEMSPWLRNLKVILVCLRNSGDGDFSDVMQSLFSMIEDAFERISPPDNSPEFSCPDDQLSNSLMNVYYLAKEVVAQWYSSTTSNSLTLELDDVVEIADSILQSTAGFREIHYGDTLATKEGGGAMDKFEVQTRFFRDFLLFTKAKQSGSDNQQLKSLLIYNRPPTVEDAARGFWIDGLFSVGVPGWAENVERWGPRIFLADVNPRVFEAYTQILLGISTLDHIDDGVLIAFLSSLISFFWDVLRNNSHSPHLDSLKALYGGLRLSRSILKQHHQFAHQIGVLIRDAGVVICSFCHTADVDPSRLSDVLQRFDTLQPQLPPESNSSKPYPLDLGGSTTTSLEDDGESQFDTVVTSFTTLSMEHDGESQFETVVASPPSNSTPREVGFQEDEVTPILDRLMRGSKQLRLVPISGMAGLGKTTFALEVYNHPSVMYHFHARAWCPISQVFNKKRVLVHLLNQICPGDYSEMSEDDVANKLRQSLKGKRYLILLDDVWNPEVLESLRPSFPDDRSESRIILTSRLHDIVPHPLSDEHTYCLRLRKDNECLKIIETKLAIGSSTELENFAKLCKGLPLMAVLVAGLLATSVQQGWESIRVHLTSGGISATEQCNRTLELSYEHLSNELKLCFVYFGVFPEDEGISAKKLIRLWMAEGFATKENDSVVARGYLDSLILRNLIMVVEKTSMGGVKVCRIHDLLHDFCLMKGKQENHFHLLVQLRDELTNFIEPCNLKRLSIHSDAPHFEESRLFCPRAQAMLFFTGSMSIYLSLSDMVFIAQIYKLLKVLDMAHIRLSVEIPSEIALLTQLTYLSICCDKAVIPFSIGNLSNLETLILCFFEAYKPISMPHTIWELEKLKILHVARDFVKLIFILPINILENSPKMLLSLDVIRGVGFFPDRSMEEQLRKFPNIRRLKCYIQHGGESLEEPNKMIVVPAFLSQLESLTMLAEGGLHYQFDFGCAESLRKVTLSGFVLSREEIAVIGELPNLEVLKLIFMDFLEGTMEMEEGEFSKLRILILGHYYPRDGSLKVWTASGDEQLPCLEKLVIRGCVNLEEIPDCLETSETLEEIVVSRCSTALETCARQIEEVQKDYGNIIKVQILQEE